LRYDVPGEDWRVDFDAACEIVGARGWAGLFQGGEAPGHGAVAPKRLIVDLGFGRGEFVADLAQKDPDAGFLGVERSFKRVLKLARRLARTEIGNLRLIEATAERVVAELLPPDSVAQFWINFPDPWPKKRHLRRRLLARAFVTALVSRLEACGSLNVATDHVKYAAAIDEILAGEPSLENAFAPERFRAQVPGRTPTAYELAWRAEGRPMHFFSYRRR
jgi:tRNA (guanine-N7-)-methyltransferase